MSDYVKTSIAMAGSTSEVNGCRKSHCLSCYQNGVWCMATTKALPGAQCGYAAAYSAAVDSLNTVTYFFDKLIDMDMYHAKKLISKNVKQATLNTMECEGYSLDDKDKFQSSLVVVATDGKTIFSFQCGNGAVWVLKNGVLRRLQLCEPLRSIQNVKGVSAMKINKDYFKGFDGFVIASEYVDWMETAPRLKGKQTNAEALVTIARDFNEECASSVITNTLITHTESGDNGAMSIGVMAVLMP